jgi:hypothetical protein
MAFDVAVVLLQGLQPKLLQERLPQAALHVALPA